MKKAKTCYLAKVADDYVFGGNLNSSHLYLVHKDKGNNKTCKLQGLTHLYIPDSKRFSQLRSGLLSKVHIDGFDCPSGLKAEILTSDFGGKQLLLKDVVNHSADGIHKVKVHFK